MSVWSWLRAIVSGRPTLLEWPSKLSRLNGEPYDFWSGHFDWLNPAAAKLDEEIRAFCGQFAASGPVERAALTQSLNRADSFALEHFAERAAVIGLRAGDADLVRSGLIATAAIDPQAVDARSAGHTLPRLYYCLTRCGADAAAAFEEVAQLAADSMSRLIRTNAKRYAAYSSIAEMGQRELVCEVASAHGAGFVRRFIKPYQPSGDILGLSLRVAELLRAESKYQFYDIVSATDLPSYCFGQQQGAPDRAHDPLAVVSVQSRLRPEHESNRSRDYMQAEWLNIYLAEAADPSTARQLAQTANDARAERAAMAAVSVESMVAIAFALTTRYSFLVVESRRTVERFREPLLQELRSVLPSRSEA
ncbi:MAG TPA: hypothetical protein VFK05_15515 [Polyangiaceae bacterium]|nr:hypothetical protein [Polyangiaceae bacterium]